MKKLVFSGCIVACLVAAPVVYESQLKEVHAGYDVSPVGLVSVCGVDVGFLNAGNLDDLRVEYGIERLQEITGDMFDEKSVKYVEPKYPEEIDGYFMYQTSDVVNTTEEIEKRVKTFKRMVAGSPSKYPSIEESIPEYEAILEVRANSSLSFEEALEIRNQHQLESKAASARYQVEFGKVVDGIGRDMYPSYVTASCLYDNEDYEKIGDLFRKPVNIINDAFANAGNIDDNWSEVENSVALFVSERFPNHTYVKYDDYRGVKLIKDGAEVDSIYVSFSPFPSLYSHTVSVGDENKVFY